ncbi:MAG: response regulator transcription factor [Saprospiraceae bacterium]|nr:response regulator transcription factor [Saprospiraceae bacterium]
MTLHEAYKAKILVVEDDGIILFDIKEVLEQEGYYVLTALNPGQALILLNTHSPDLVLLDIHLESDITGIDLAKYIMDQNLGISFIYLTSYTDSKTLEQVKGTTPAAYIAKPFHQAQLKSTIELVLADQKKKLQNSTLTLEQLNKRLSIGLTDKEWIITQLLAQGKSNEQMGAQLKCSINTVKFHIKNIYDKLEVHSRSELLIKLRK